MRVRRYDAGALDSGKVRPLAAGGVAIPAFCTRTGVFPYADANGDIRHELRLPADVFDSVSLDSLAHAPVTVDHPPVKVDASNWREYAVGSISPSAQPLDRYVQCTVVVNEANALARIDARELVELSCGYDCELVVEPGEYEGIHYDMIQRNIRYNHVALLKRDEGRAGGNVALRLDSKAAIRIGDWKMALRIDGKDVPANEEQRAVDTVVAARDTAQGRADVAEAKVKDLEKALAEAKDPKLIQDAATKRARLLYACKVLAAKFDKKTDEAAAANASDSDLMVRLVKLANPNIDLTGKSPDYILGVFEATVTPIIEAYAASAAPPAEVVSETPPPALDSLFTPRELTKTTAQTRDDSHDADKAYEDMLKNNQERGTRLPQNGRA